MAKQRTQKRASASVAVAYPHAHEVSARFHKSMYALLVYDSKNRRRLVDGGWLPVSSGANVTNARNEIVEAFLKTGIEWLWFIDTDMTFEPNVLDRLVAVADKKERPIVGALCFKWKDGKTAVPTIYGINENNQVVEFFDYQPNTLVPCMTGAGCVLIHRSVLLKMAEEFPKPYQWFREEAYNGMPIGEDITFCLRAIALGFDVFVDTSIQVGHEKPIVIDASVHQAQGAGRLQVQNLPNTVVIPVKNNKHLTVALVNELQSQGGYAEIVVIDNGSTDGTAEVLEGVTVLNGVGLGIHEMWNLGLEHLLQAYGPSQNITFLNNDVAIGEQFLTRLGAALRLVDDLVVVCPNYDKRNMAYPLQEVDQICAGKYDGTGGLAGFAMCIRGEFFADGYRFPEQFKWWYGDNDLLLTIKAANKKAAIARDVSCEHLDGGSLTTKAEDQAAFNEAVEKDREAFLAKWKVQTVGAEQ